MAEKRPRSHYEPDCPARTRTAADEGQRDSDEQELLADHAVEIGQVLEDHDFLGEKSLVGHEWRSIRARGVQSDSDKPFLDNVVAGPLSEVWIFQPVRGP